MKGSEESMQKGFDAAYKLSMAVAKHFSKLRGQLAVIHHIQDRQFKDFFINTKLIKRKFAYFYNILFTCLILLRYSSSMKIHLARRYIGIALEYIKI